MEIRIEDELYARSLGWEVMTFLRQNENDLLDLQQEVNNDTLDDPECFQRIELIVQTFYANGISTRRHDLGINATQPPITDGCVCVIGTYCAPAPLRSWWPPRRRRR